MGKEVQLTHLDGEGDKEINSRSQNKRFIITERVLSLKKSPAMTPYNMCKLQQAS